MAKRFRCTECKEVFLSRDDLRLHMRGAHETADRTCPQCDKVFSSATVMRNHVNSVHLDIREHKCDICGQEFVRRAPFSLLGGGGPRASADTGGARCGLSWDPLLTARTW